MSNWKLSGTEEFHEDAARILKEYEALARDIIKTLPPEEWPPWVKNYVHDDTWGKRKPVDWTPYPHEDALNGDTFPEAWGKVAAISTPANYTPEDPLDLQGKQPIFQAMDTQWWTLPQEEAKRAVVNAFRATMLSPRMNLRGNAILYQSLMNVDPNESNPEVFEGIIRALKQNWDQQGQTGFEDDPSETLAVDQILPGKFQPGIWTNIRRIAALGPYADEIYKAALTDVYQYGGTGHYFRNKILALNIPGVKSKVASFAWLALAPMTSELGTIDVHMMRHLGEDDDSPRNTKHYMELEDRLRQERDQLYPGTPLTQYQWGVWDKRRTPGFHQDHTPLKPIDPTPYTDIHWAPQPRPPRPQRLPEADPNQLGFQFGKVGWQLVKNPLQPAPQDEIKWIRPDYEQDFKHFVRDVMARVGLPPWYEPEGKAYEQQYHDLVLNITKGAIPFDGWVNNKRVNYTRGLDFVVQRLPVVMQKQIPDKDYRDVNDREHADKFYNGILPNDPKMRSQYPRSPMDQRTQYSKWSFIRLGGYSLKGNVVGVGGRVPANGIAIVLPPGNISEGFKRHVFTMLDQLRPHEQDVQKQRKIIPDYAINRGGKVADIRYNPDMTGYSYGDGAIIVAGWVDVEHNWLLYHDAIDGIVAGAGGSTSHGVNVARERNIPIVVDVSNWDKIQMGDYLQVDPVTGRIDVNGGTVEDLGEATNALEPVLAFVWSQGYGLQQPIPPGSGGAAVLHRPMLRQMKQEGRLNKQDYAIGVVYADGRIQMQGTPTDEEALQQWIQSVHQVKNTESEPTLLAST